MSKIQWDQTGERLYETGVDHAVVYPYNKTSSKYAPGVAWNGITSVNESPSGAEENALYADNIKYLAPRSREEFGATVEAYTYPDEFATLDGTAEIVSGMRIGQQTRGLFGLSYRTLIGNDVDGDDHGYQLHLIYGATASPSEKSRETVNEDPDAVQFSWEIATVPVAVTGFKPTSHITIDSTKFDTTERKALLAALEAKLYGTDAGTGTEATDPELPLPDEVATLLGYTAESGD